MSLWKMSSGQMARYAKDEIETLEDDAGLNEWLPEVVADLASVQVGVFRCGHGDRCDICSSTDLWKGDCECCLNEELWESPLTPGWEPECIYCWRKALLVEVVGTRDYAYAV